MTSTEEIDLDTLQANIDLSMAFADNLVSTWFPTTKGPSSTINKLEQDVLSQMKLPSKLGVGASVSETAATSSREANKLKGRLIGKKRPRDDERPPLATRQDPESSDEEESRAGAIHKKARADPFAKKGKKNLEVSVSLPPRSQGALKFVTNGPPSPAKPNPFAMPPPPSKPSEESKPSITSHEAAKPGDLLMAPPSPTAQRKFSLTTAPLPSSSTNSVNVLNLDGPPKGDDESDDDDATAATEPATGDADKKKRRRKKRKNKNKNKSKDAGQQASANSTPAP
ncbi:hypothetical protein CYLTODRAFT_439489 [Cylindrobasidium torrendii FP15055 ss-10]|uniref:Uncharacterized protein n=1 Tax=Cylindrobasidium torrendii FP15055 ss-10 TaxID=1314674 RepID=A0A0D7BUP8_9AGAR|nr:hypothetical protein CYLTODRAFT_439489 [Cylindrobasidium torrendii FP15055 ss-10]